MRSENFSDLHIPLCSEAVQRVPAPPPVRKGESLLAIQRVLCGAPVEHTRSVFFLSTHGRSAQGKHRLTSLLQPTIVTSPSMASRWRASTARRSSSTTRRGREVLSSPQPRTCFLACRSRTAADLRNAGSTMSPLIMSGLTSLREHGANGGNLSSWSVHLTQSQSQFLTLDLFHSPSHSRSGCHCKCRQLRFYGTCSDPVP